jgi:hypothetical protein
MTDYHHNIFYCYKGAHQSHQEGERQLENNTTKALVNTLEYCSDPVALGFLEWIGITAAGEQIKFKLQKKTIGEQEIRAKSQRLLLGIVPTKGDENHTAVLDGRGTEEDTCPDAWIYGGDFVVLIESKVIGPLDPDQMRCHAHRLQGGMEQQLERKECTWAEVHGFFKGLPNKLGDKLSDKDKWILGQFTQYLEEIGMSEFIGLESEIFNYVVTLDDEDARQKVYATMRSFAEKIIAQIRDLAFYDGYDVGVIHRGDRYCWVAFGPKGNKYRQWAHQTVALDAYGIDVFVNLELKAVTDRLKERIRRNRQAFREAILSLLPDEPFSVQVEERKQRQASIYDYHSIATLDARYLKNSELGAYGFDYIETLVEQVSLPYLTVRRRIDRNKALELSQKDQGRPLVSEVTRIIQAFHPLVRFINEESH